MYDHAQSPRLGQRTPVENPGVQLVSSLTLPEVAYRGQIVYALDNDQFYVFDGVAWQQPVGSGGGSGVGVQTFVGPTEPAADHVGDLWLSTTDYQLRVWDGTHWQHTTNSQEALYQRTSIALAKALMHRTPVMAHQVIWYDTVPPSSPVAYDIWVNVTTNLVYEWVGGTWAGITDPGLSGPILDAANERSILDGVIEIYTDSVAPLGLTPNDIGDLWVVSNLANLIRGWNGAMWIDLQITSDVIGDQAVGTDQIADNAVDGTRQIITGTIVNGLLADNVITSDKIADFAVPVMKLFSLEHHIY